MDNAEHTTSSGLRPIHDEVRRTGRRLAGVSRAFRRCPVVFCALCYASARAARRDALLWYAMLWSAMLCDAMLCYAMLCGGVLCEGVPWRGGVPWCSVVFRGVGIVRAMLYDAVLSIVRSIVGSIVGDADPDRVADRACRL
eukprot:2914436-Pyramimonas_sp.AAC.1